MFIFNTEQKQIRYCPNVAYMCVLNVFCPPSRNSWANDSGSFFGGKSCQLRHGHRPSSTTCVLAATSSHGSSTWSCQSRSWPPGGSRYVRLCESKCCGIPILSNEMISFPNIIREILVISGNSFVGTQICCR